MCLIPLVLLLLCLSKIGNSLNNDCLKQVLFSSKTPYKLIENLDATIEKPLATCVPIQINMVHRHGNRYPSAKDTRNMNIAIQKINRATETLVSGINLQLPYECQFQEKQDKLLSHVGETELYQLGKRLHERFPELFTKKYSPLDYQFQSSCKLRCTHSSNALAAGLFETTGVLGNCGIQPIAIESAPCNNDPKLRFFEMCSKYKKSVLKNPNSFQELKDFMGGPEVNSVIEKVKLRLGLPELDLNSKDIWSLIIACAYDIGMHNGTLNDGICALFNLEDLKIMEYAYDLKHYYKRSIGEDEITFEISCLLLKDITDSLEMAIKNSSYAYQGVFRSSHAETIIPLYALLGIYLDDVKLTSKNYAEMKNRKFRAGCTSPFSGHLYFVLYNCEEDGYKVQLYVNERLVKIPCCESKLRCDVEVFLKCYQSKIDSCHLQKMCESKKDESKKEL